MTTLESSLEWEVWQAAGCATRIEYSRVLMEELRIAATDGFNRLSHGGVEIGGVLFGVRTPGSIKILAQRELRCEYAFGPSFTLSENDARAFEDLIASTARDADLSGMQAVGWYHSHTRSDISLSEKDLQLYQRYFPEAWQIALVLRPHRFDPVRAGFFFRELDGSIHTQQSRKEFIIHPGPGKRTVRSDPGADPVDASDGAAAVAVAPAITVQRLPAEEQWVSPHERRRATVAFLKPIWIWRVATLVLAAGVIIYCIANLRHASGVSLRALDVGGQLRIEWNCDARAIRNASSGKLEIDDGSQKVENELSKDQLRIGSLTYMRNTENVLVRLRLRRADQAIVTETTQFLGSPAQTGTLLADDGTLADNGTDPLPETRATERPEMVSAPSPLPTEKPSLRQLDGGLEVGRKSGGKPESAPQTSSVPSKPGRRFEIPGASVARSSSPDVVAPTVPMIPAMASNPAPALPELLPRLPAPQLPKPVYRGSSEGKIIWAGKLARHGNIEIQGSRASQGYLTGGLPGVPVRVQVFPAEFTPVGLRIFTADSKTNGNTEAPGAQNGWNRTTYVWNPAQLDKLRVIEAPGPENAWNRVTLRAERGEHSIIVLRWELADMQATHAVNGQ